MNELETENHYAPPLKIPKGYAAGFASHEEWLAAQNAKIAAAAANNQAQDAAKRPSTRQMFLENLPKLNTRRNCRAYITALATGFAAGSVDPNEARIMLQLAQTALAAAPKPQPRPSRARKQDSHA